MNIQLELKRTADAQRGQGGVTHQGDLLKLESATDTLLLETADKMLLEVTNG